MKDKCVLKGMLKDIIKKNSRKIFLNQKGFTLIECILAVGILSTVLFSIVALQSSIINTTQISSDKIKAIWALKSTLSQLEYILNTDGQAAVPDVVHFPWTGDKQFTITVQRVDLKKIKPSQFLFSALKVANLSPAFSNQHIDVDKTFGPIGAILDNTLENGAAHQPAAPTAAPAKSKPTSITSQSNFSNVIVKVQWNDGSTNREISSGLFLIDDSLFSDITIPQTGDSAGGGTSNSPKSPSTPSGQ